MNTTQGSRPPRNRWPRGRAPEWVAGAIVASMGALGVWAFAPANGVRPEHRSGTSTAPAASTLSPLDRAQAELGQPPARSATSVHPLSPVRAAREETASLGHASAALMRTFAHGAFEQELPGSALDHAAKSVALEFQPDWQDPSEANLARVESAALGGNANAVDAFLILAAGRSDYAERSHDVLLKAAARGNALALVTLAERSYVGYGFPSPSADGAALFEYLAWRTGTWARDATATSFHPTHAPTHFSESVCRAVVGMGNQLASQSIHFRARTMSAEQCATIEGTL